MLDCPLFATNPPFDPKSSRVPFPECLYTKHFPKHALLDLLRSLMTGGKVNQNRRNSRHFPQGWKCQVPPAVPVESVPQTSTGESEPFSPKNPALSRGREWRVPPERPVEPVPRSAAGESEPFSPKNPALSPGEEMAGAAREACGTGVPASRGGK